MIGNGLVMFSDVMQAERDAWALQEILKGNNSSASAKTIWSHYLTERYYIEQTNIHFFKEGRE